MKAQGLQISTIIIALLGIIVLLILIFALTKQTGLFGKSANESTTLKECISTIGEQKPFYECENPLLEYKADPGLVCCKRQT